MGKWNRERFKVVTLAIDVYTGLKALKQSPVDSFSDILRRLLKLVEREKEMGWSIVRPVENQVKEFWSSDLFGGSQQ